MSLSHTGSGVREPLVPLRTALGFARCDEARLGRGVMMITRAIPELRGRPSP